MDIDKERDLLIQAISYYEGYTRKQREVLKLLIKLSINDIVIVSPGTIQEVTNVSMPVIYAALTLFKKHGIISPIATDKGIDSKNRYSINRLKFNDIIERFKKITSLTSLKNS